MKVSTVGFYYHVISNKPLGHISHLFSYKSQESFERDLVYLKRHYNPVSYGEYATSIHSGKDVKPNSALLTFDDGYAECYSTVRPLLIRYEIPCIFFVVTDLVDNKEMLYRNKISLCIEKAKSSPTTVLAGLLAEINKAFNEDIRDLISFMRWLKGLNAGERDMMDKICVILGVDIRGYLSTNRPYLTSDEIRSLASDGFTIGGHGKSHCPLSHLSNEEIEEEIVTSCKIIMDLTGEKEVPFAFPFSGEGIDRRFLKDLVTRHKFLGLFFDTGGLRQDEDFIVNRVFADQPTPSYILPRSNIPHLLRNAAS